MNKCCRYCVVACLFLFGACGKSSKQPRLLFIGKNLQNDYHITIAKGVMQEAVKHGMAVDVVGPNTESDFEYQRNKIAEAVQSGKYAGVVLEPNHSVELATAVSRLSEARIPVVTVDTPVSFTRDTPARYCGFVGTDNVNGGQMAARFLSRKIKSGNVVLVRGLVNHRTSLDREKGFVEEIKARYPGIRVIETLDGNWDGPTTLKLYRGFIATLHPHVDAVFALNDDMAVAVAGYYRFSSSRPLIIGFNGGKEAQAKILGGDMDASVAQFPMEMGEMAVSRLYECMQAKVHDVRNELISPQIMSAVTTVRMHAE